MSDEPQLIIFVPAKSEGDPLSDGLRRLTGELYKRLPDADDSYGMGGENGYGVNYENDVFMMHRYCWCDKPDCLWCTPWLSNDNDVTEAASVAHREKQHAEAVDKYGPWITSIGYGAPHFWHKPSGFQMVWYKWIGRDNQFSRPSPPLAQMFNECLGSIK